MPRMQAPAGRPYRACPGDADSVIRDFRPAHTGRRRGRHLRGMAISALGYGITVGSYLGGALVFGSGIGIDQDEWHSFATVLEAHADEEERDMIPVPASVKMTDAELVELGDQMATRIEQLRESTVHKLRVKGRKSMLRAL